MYPPVYDKGHTDSIAGDSISDKAHTDRVTGETIDSAEGDTVDDAASLDELKVRDVELVFEASLIYNIFLKPQLPLYNILSTNLERSQ